MAEPSVFEPRMVGFLCNWCSYAGADLAGVSRFQYAPNLRVIRVMCSTRVDPVFVLRPFLRGLDGVLVLGCHLGDCHYLSGNYHTQHRMRMMARVLEMVGLDPNRLYLDWVSASEGRRFADLVNAFTERIRGLGPLGEKEGLDREVLKERLLAAEDALSGDRLRWLVGKEKDLVEEGNVYEESVDSAQLEHVMEEDLRGEYVKRRILLLLRRGDRSVKEMAGELDLLPSEVLRYVNTMENAGLVGMSGVEGRSPKYGVVEG